MWYLIDSLNPSFEVWVLLIVMTIFGAPGVTRIVRGLRERKRLRASPQLSVAEVATRLQDVPYTQCSIAGAAESGERGTYAAPWSREPCVWHHDKAVETYTAGGVSASVSTGDIQMSKGSTERRRTEERYGDIPVREINVRDDTGSIAVRDVTSLGDPHEAFRVEKRPKWMQFEVTLTLPDREIESTKYGTLGAIEWILRPGERVFVIGEAVRRETGIAINATTVSTADRASAWRKTRREIWGGIGSIVTGLVVAAVLYASI